MVQPAQLNSVPVTREEKVNGRTSKLSLGKVCPVSSHSLHLAFCPSCCYPALNGVVKSQTGRQRGDVDSKFWVIKLSVIHVKSPLASRTEGAKPGQNSEQTTPLPPLRAPLPHQTPMLSDATPLLLFSRTTQRGNKDKHY